MRMLCKRSWLTYNSPWNWRLLSGQIGVSPVNICAPEFNWSPTRRHVAPIQLQGSSLPREAAELVEISQKARHLVVHASRFKNILDEEYNPGSDEDRTTFC